jgi:hypothetical protein
MKNLKVLGLIAFLGFITSCEKDMQAPISQMTKTSTPIQAFTVNLNACAKDMGGIVFDGTMLVFQDGNHFTRVMTCLSEQVDNNEENFENQTASMTDDDANRYAQSIRYEEDQPLIDFENSLGFYSLRSKLSAASEQWLNNPVLDETTNPDNHVIVDDVLRALLNTAGKIKIGNQVCDFSSPMYPYRGGPSCYLWGRTLAPAKRYDNGKKQLWVRTSLLGIPFAGHSVAKVKGVSYRLARGGQAWERFRTNLTADIGGTARDGHCDNVARIANIKTRKRSAKITCRYFSFYANNYDTFPFWYAQDNDFTGLVQSNNHPDAYSYVPIRMIWY